MGHILTLNPGADGVGRSSLVLVPSSAVRDACYLEPPDAGHVAVRAYRAGHVEVIVEAGEAARLVLPEVHYPGWRVEVDGRAAPLEVHEETFLAVRLTPGPHAVVFRFQPLSFRIGVAFAVLTVLILIAWRVRVRRLLATTPVSASLP